jgi:hypothetical protein
MESEEEEKQNLINTKKFNKRPHDVSSTRESNESMSKFNNTRGSKIIMFHSIYPSNDWLEGWREA